MPADALIFDLEDAVAPDAKLLAREQVCEAVHGCGYGGREIVIRVNALETPWGAEDLIAACAAEPDAILVPKVVYSGDILSAAKILQSVHVEKIRLWAMMETPMAILNARTIAATAVHAENRLCCLVMGTNDLLKESRARALHDRFAVVPWLAMTREREERRDRGRGPHGRAAASRDGDAHRGNRRADWRNGARGGDGEFHGEAGASAAPFPPGGERGRYSTLKRNMPGIALSKPTDA